MMWSHEKYRVVRDREYDNFCCSKGYRQQVRDGNKEVDVRQREIHTDKFFDK